MKSTPKRSWFRKSCLLPTISMLVLAVALPAQANHLPADKIGVSASAVEVMTATASPIGPVSSGPVVLLQATLRNSTPTDLMIRFTGESALWTDIVSPSSDAMASVKIWAEIDGSPVPVTSDANGDGVANDPDDGRVVLANRDFRIASLISADVISLYLSTRNAGAFQWMALNVGSGIHNVVLKGQLDVQVAGAGLAKAAVGKRTLFVEPAKLANDATVAFADPPAVGASPSASPQALRWGSIGPNPFRSAVDLELRARRSGPASVTVYSVAGQRVARLYAGHLDAGSPHLSWDGRDLQGRPAPAGFYVVEARMGAETATARVERLQ